MDRKQPIMRQMEPRACVWPRPLTDLARGNHVLVLGVLVDRQTQDVVCVLQVEALSSCGDRKQEVPRTVPRAGGSQQTFTGRQVVDDGGGGGVEDDVSTVVQVVKVVPAVEAAVAKDVVQQQLLRRRGLSRGRSSSRGRRFKGGGAQQGLKPAGVGI